MYAETYMTYDSPITCSTGKTSNITIEDDIVNSNITSCEDHYVLVKDSYDYNYCGMHTKNTFQAHLTSKTKNTDIHNNTTERGNTIDPKGPYEYVRYL
jgi:hypothetical protein